MGIILIYLLIGIVLIIQFAIRERLKSKGTYLGFIGEFSVCKIFWVTVLILWPFALDLLILGRRL